MKGNGKNPTRRQKILIRKAGLNLENWLVRREDERYLYLIHRRSGNAGKVLKWSEFTCSKNS